ncbi:MAG: DUF2292 domain-containing protein [Candidatus Coatesbacteria bacterium]|nr:MAG: DUF2292 domain-containing protein [Candidatus Coatesbacteria bacterium]
MTREEAQKVAEAIKKVQEVGHGSVEVVIQNGKILDIVKKERERIS